MIDGETMDAGVFSRILQSFPVKPAVSDEQMLENVRSALTRGLPKAGIFKRHGRTISVAAGGPSLADTFGSLSGDIAAVNGSLRFLLERNVKPWACGVLDPGEHMADIVEARPDVFYFVASVCHPRTFDHLKECSVILWHPSGMPELDDIEGIDLQVGGGSTMGLRWVNLAYLMGYRSFHLHGLDSSFRGDATHAYPDRRDGQFSTVINGRATSLNFVQQVADFIDLIERFSMPDVEPIGIQVHGDGLLQDVWRQHYLRKS